MGDRKLKMILRCTGLALVVLGACNPLNHGVSIFKSCVSPKNRCGVDADCSDANICNGIELCATAHPDGAPSGPGSNVTECTITLSNPLSHCDNLTILDASDTITNGTGSPLTSSSIQITGTSTGVVSGTCTAGTDLGGAVTCTIAPGGSVSFLSNFYTIVPTDPTTLNDQAGVNVMDTCSASPTGCSTTPSLVQFTASTTTQSGCSPGTPLTCNDNNACTTDTCDPAIGCVFTPNPPCNDNNACTTDTCDPAIGCVFTPNPPCNDNNACTTDTCDPAIGCVYTPNPPCNDNNPCTDDTCDPAIGCVFTPNNACVTNEICRTPGFWGTHACPEPGVLPGTECTLAGSVCEKANSQNITQIVLNDFTGTCGPLLICGNDITNTCLNDQSAVEAICVAVKGDSTLQVARQLTAAALNCILSNSSDTTAGTCTGAGENCADVCAGVSVDAAFTACNDPANLCATTATLTDGTVINCIEALDCFKTAASASILRGLREARRNATTLARTTARSCAACPAPMRPPLELVHKLNVRGARTRAPGFFEGAFGRPFFGTGFRPAPKGFGIGCR